MNTPDLLHAYTKLQALRKLNRARGLRAKLNERALDDSLTMLAKWYDAPDGSEEQQRAWETWLHSPLPSW